MAKLFFSLKLWSATSSIPVMKMLAEQAEANITRAIYEADLPGAITEEQFVEEDVDERGKAYSYTVTYFTCGSCTGVDADEVISEYKHLITQLTRRSAFLTMFGLFEHRMVRCLELMDHLSGLETEKVFKTVEDCHKRLKGAIGAKHIKDIDQLAAIRIIMAHSDGIAENYHELVKSNVKTTPIQKRQIRAIRRALNDKAGIKINGFNGVLMDERFLSYAVGEFERYVGELDTAVRDYQKRISSAA